MQRNKKQKVKVVLNFNILLLIIIPLVFIGITAAKYVQEKGIELLYQAKAFYFESDFLGDNTNPKAYTFETGNTTISITLKNSADDLRCSEVDIKYNIQITDVNGNSVKDKSGKTLEAISGQLDKDNFSSKKIEFANLKSGTYVVTATSTKPYKKTIQATFLISDTDNSVEYYINDSINSPVIQLTILTKDYNGNIDITWPSGVAPDTTLDFLSEINTGYAGGTATISFKADSEYVLQFFKSKLDIKYTKDNFSVERSK